MTFIFRDRGAVGALLDEYEKAISELIQLCSEISPHELITQVDYKTKDKDCISIQSILTHVLRAGYNYVIAIRKHIGEEIDYVESRVFTEVEAYQKGLLNLMDYNVKLFDEHPNLELEEKEPKKKILTTWGQVYDVEQLFEHAIVHVLRHRRQIERFLLKLRNPS